VVSAQSISRPCAKTSPETFSPCQGVQEQPKSHYQMCFERKRRFHMHSNRRWQESHFSTNDFHQKGNLPLRAAFSVPNIRPVAPGTKVLNRGLQFYRCNRSQQSQNNHQQDIKLQIGTREHTDILYALKDSCKSELCRTSDWDLFKRVSSARDH
jgi:hypothetical protein